MIRPFHRAPLLAALRHPGARRVLLSRALDCLCQTGKPAVAADPDVVNATLTQEQQTGRCDRSRHLAADAASAGPIFRATSECGNLRAYSLPVHPAVPFHGIEDRHRMFPKRRGDAPRAHQKMPSKTAETNANAQQIPTT